MRVSFRSFILGGVLASGLLWAGTSNLPQIVTSVIQRAHVNDIRTALYQDLVPRNGSGSTTSVGGSLGTATYKWLKARIASGYWNAGDIKIHHSYNGAVLVEEGWMLMDGDIINETNYDAEHGSGHWDTYVVTSPLDGKYLPNMASKYVIGSATTTQSGSSAITFSGNASNQINIQHSHSASGMSAARNLWYKARATTNDDQTYDHIDGGLETVGLVSIKAGAVKNSLSILVGNTNTINGTYPGVFFPLRVESAGGDDNHIGDSGATVSGSIGNGLSTTQSIAPESLAVQYYMRIID